jgi:hypothetical protein
MAKPTRQSAKTTLDKVLGRGLSGILDKVSAAHGVTREDICGRRRTAPIARARHELWWHMRNLPMTYDEIGHLFGRLHSTVVRGIVAYRHTGLVPEVPLNVVNGKKSKATAKPNSNGPHTVANLEAKLQRLAAEFAQNVADALRGVPIQTLASVRGPKLTFAKPIRGRLSGRRKR